MTSKSVKVWAKTPSSVSAIYGATLYAGITTLTVGVFIYDITPTENEQTAHAFPSRVCDTCESPYSLSHFCKTAFSCARSASSNRTTTPGAKCDCKTGSRPKRPPFTSPGGPSAITKPKSRGNSSSGGSYQQNSP